MPNKTSIQEPCQRASKTYNQVSCQRILRQTFMPKKNLTPLTSFQNSHSKTMPTLRVNITEERGTHSPAPTDQGEERSGAVLPMGKAVLPSGFGLYYLSLNDSSFRTFSAAPCLGRFEPNAPGGGGGDDI